MALRTLPFHMSVTSDIPSNGLYFFYETDERNAHDGEARIVRVGNHPRRQGRLPNRLRDHYSGTKNGSVFRKFLGGALMRKEEPDHPCLAPSPGQGHWEMQDASVCSLCAPVEERVSELLREQFRFRCVRIVDRTERNRMEEGLIASLAACPECKASANWLGHHAYNAALRESGLWNSQHVRSSPTLSGPELLRFETLVRESAVP